MYASVSMGGRTYGGYKSRKFTAILDFSVNVLTQSGDAFPMEPEAIASLKHIVVGNVPGVGVARERKEGGVEEFWLANEPGTLLHAEEIIKRYPDLWFATGKQGAFTKLYPAAEIMRERQKRKRSTSAKNNLPERLIGICQFGRRIIVGKAFRDGKVNVQLRLSFKSGRQTGATVDISHDFAEWLSDGLQELVSGAGTELKFDSAGEPYSGFRGEFRDGALVSP